MAPPENLKWFTFDAATPDGALRETWSVYLTEMPVAPGDRTQAYGYTHYPSRTIAIDAVMSRDDQDETLLHELMHVASNMSWRDTGAELPLEAEEKAVHHICPALHGLIKMHGWTPPKRPKGAAALEARARKRRRRVLG